MRKSEIISRLSYIHDTSYSNVVSYRNHDEKGEEAIMILLDCTDGLAIQLESLISDLKEQKGAVEIDDQT